MVDQRNLILAVVLSVAILLGYQFLFAPEKKPAPAQTAGQTQTTPTPAKEAPTGPAPQVPGTPAAAPAPTTTAPAAATGPRVRIESPRLSGSIALSGARLDDVVLSAYKETRAKDSPAIVLLAPKGGEKAYFAEFGWVGAGDAAVRLPSSDTMWTADRQVLAPGQPVTLSWNNGQGLTFRRTIDLDDAFMFTVSDEVVNTGGTAATLHPFGLLSRSGTPQTTNFYILHEGLLGVFGGTLDEVKYNDLREEKGGVKSQQTTGGWLGITDKYWLAALVPDQATPVTARFVYDPAGGKDRYQADFLGSAVSVPAGGSAKVTNRFFAGAKEVQLLDRYETQLGINNFDLAIDFGWFYFLTKPLFLVLLFIHKYLGNMGISILLLTVLVKAAFFPLANKSYVAMSKMKKLQPEMKKLQERFAGDKMRLNQEMMALYKREKANPASGCLPVLIQIPVFFALYKVLFVTIEMRHAPFFGWIKDLSAPDPTTMFNLFGLIPWDPPAFLMIGVWPLIMGITMFLQQKLNPAPTDPVQAKVFMFLPIMFTFMLASFPAGLVIYWAWNNVLSIAQQWVIMRRMGVPAT